MVAGGKLGSGVYRSEPDSLVCADGSGDFCPLALLGQNRVQRGGGLPVVADRAVSAELGGVDLGTGGIDRLVAGLASEAVD